MSYAPLPAQSRPPRVDARRLAPTLFRVTAFALLILAGCHSPDPPGDYVARVGTRVFTRSDLSSALKVLPAASDSTEARQQILEQWITNELLYREAVDTGLRRDSSVLRLLADNEKSVLISALLSRVFSEQRQPPPESALRNYYERHRDQLVLREPFVRVRYLVFERADSAQAAYRQLDTIVNDPNPDSLWMVLERRYSDSTDRSQVLSSSYYPESRLLTESRALHDIIQTLSPGQTSPVVQFGGRYHVIQLQDRLPAGTLPDLDIIREQITERVEIENRKQLYARHVQRLRNEALAREDLVIR